MTAEQEVHILLVEDDEGRASTVVITGTRLTSKSVPAPQGSPDAHDPHVRHLHDSPEVYLTDDGRILIYDRVRWHLNEVGQLEDQDEFLRSNLDEPAYIEVMNALGRTPGATP